MASRQTRSERIDALVANGSSVEEATRTAEALEDYHARLDAEECPKCSARMSVELGATSVDVPEETWVHYQCSSIFCRTKCDRLEPIATMGWALECDEWGAIVGELTAAGQHPSAWDVTMEQRRRMRSRHQRPMTRDEVLREFSPPSTPRTDASHSN